MQPFGQIASTDALGNRTAYAYDRFGNLASVTDPLGNTTVYGYDLRGNKTHEGGATYPVRYAYDVFGNKVAMTTYRDESQTGGDVTTWLYDEPSGLVTNKLYADGKGPSYSYAPNGLPFRSISESGRGGEYYYNDWLEVISAHYSDGETISVSYDGLSRVVSSSNEVAITYSLCDCYGQVTNENASVDGASRTIVRSFDGFGRLSGIDGAVISYDPKNGRLESVSNAIALAEYRYTFDGYDSGYTLTLSNGTVFARSVSRDGRRLLVTGVTNSVGGVAVDGLSYSYNALKQPTVRNIDTFGYNGRGELVSATIAGNTSTYGYDGIGNSTFYQAGILNQYSEFPYDIDGNMLSDGKLTFTFDAANRLKSVTSNGVVIATNFYDANFRRVRKVTSGAVTSFFYDEWNLIEERIAFAGGEISEVKYYWGKDMSGTFHGAGGVGGLLYLTINGAIYVPFYDSNGNVMRYCDSRGDTVVQYSYDAFGNTITKIGPMSDIFHHRFSTKYYDSETGLYYYGHRFYNPAVMRWINRDPIGESGGSNLYMFCNNNPMVHVDMIGYSVWDYVPFISTARAAIEVYIGHIPGSSATDYPFVSPKDCICDKINAEEQCKEKVKIMSSQYAKEAIIKAMFAKIIDLYVAFNVIKAKPLISALFFADTLLNASLNAKAYSMVMIGTRDALKNNCSCSLFESQQED